MSDTFNIYPNINVSKKIVSGKISVYEYIPFTSARVSCLLCDENNSAIENRCFFLEGEDFLSWGTDDKYLINWVKKKLHDE
jgi:hypothetical protein